MANNFDKEIQQNIEEIEKKIKDEEKEDGTKAINNLVSIFIKKMEQIQEKQRNMEIKIEKMHNTIDSLEKELYIEDEYDFNIVCPYCDYEFTIEYDEEKKETECPECHNIIELDWSGETDDNYTGCTGNCSRCGGCENDEDIGEDEN